MDAFKLAHLWKHLTRRTNTSAPRLAPAGISEKKITAINMILSERVIGWKAASHKILMIVLWKLINHDYNATMMIITMIMIIMGVINLTTDEFDARNIVKNIEEEKINTNLTKLQKMVRKAF